MTPEKIQKIMELIRKHGQKCFFEGIYSERTGQASEKRLARYQDESEKLGHEIQKELTDELPQTDVCEGCGQRDVLCVCNQE